MKRLLTWIYDGTGFCAFSRVQDDGVPFEYGIIFKRGYFWIVGDSEVIGTRLKKFKTIKGAVDFCQRQEDSN